MMMLKENLVKQIKDLRYGPLWLDESFSKKFGALSEETAFIKPQPGIHSVAELTSHLTVWIKACMDRMMGIENDLKDNDANDWRANELLEKTGWEDLKREFYITREKLVAFLEEKDEDFLYEKYPFAGFNNLDILNGLIHHDAYHMGQIGITIKLIKA